MASADQSIGFGSRLGRSRTVIGCDRGNQSSTGVMTVERPYYRSKAAECNESENVLRLAAQFVQHRLHFGFSMAIIRALRGADPVP